MVHESSFTDTDMFGEMTTFNSQLQAPESHSAHINLILISCWVICGQESVGIRNSQRKTKVLK